MGEISFLETVGLIFCLLCVIVLVVVTVSNVASWLYDLNFKIGRASAFRRGWQAAYTYFHENGKTNFPASPPDEVEREHL